MTSEENKKKFIEWLEMYAGQKCLVEYFVDFFEKTSEATKQYRSKVDFWSILDVKVYNAIRIKLSGIRIFKFLHPRLFAFMEKYGKLYSIYLKEKFNEIRIIERNPDITKEEKKIDEVQRIYIYHIKFGFGVVVKDSETSFDVVFDGYNESKTMSKNHPTISFITQDEYENKKIPLVCNVEDTVVGETLIEQSREDVKSDIETDSGYLRVDLNKPIDLSFSTPTIVKYFDTETSVNSWKEVYVATLKFLMEDYYTVFLQNVGKSLIGASRIDIGTKPENMTEPRAVGAGLYVETNLSANSIIKRIKIFLDKCFVDYENVIIEYSKSKKNTTRYGDSKQKQTIEKKKESCIYPEGILALLEGHYKYGFRINSPIEIMRIRNYASNEGIELPEDDEQLKSEISNVGFTMDDKVYVFGEEIVNELENRINSIFEQGFNLIFFDAYMDKDSEWLSENHILTVELLKELLAKTKLELFYGKNFISGKGKVTEIGGIVEEIKGIWGESVLITNNEMEEGLPYIPDDRIRHALSASDEMVWVSHETYTCLEKVIISSEDAEKIITYVSDTCDKKGFASISDVPLKNVIEENFELSMTAIYEAVFNKVLKNRFFLNGKIITKTSSGLDAVTLVKAYCEDKEECSFEELYNKVVELTGASNRQIAFEAGYGVMVRVGENRFVADKHVSFDVSYIDSLLEEIISEGFTSIKDITTFARFSICGQEWNHYLLESYCYRFSKKFTLNVINFNDKNAGIISKKTLGLSYKEMLAKTIVKAKIELTENIALQYLYDNGYLAKRQYGAIGEVLKIAESLR